MKTCKTCHETKDETEFYVKQKGLPERRAHCKPCHYVRNKAYALSPKSKETRRQDVKWRRKQPSYREYNRIAQAEYREKNREKVREYMKIYMRTYHKNRMKTDPAYADKHHAYQRSYNRKNREQNEAV